MLPASVSATSSVLVMLARFFNFIIALNKICQFSFLGEVLLAVAAARQYLGSILYGFA